MDQSQPELFRGTGLDNQEYRVIPFEWTLEKAERYCKEFTKHKIFSDDVPRDLDSFLTTMLSSNSLWFEVVGQDGENYGFMYLTEFIPSLTEKRFISATFHAVTWDGKAAPRIEIAKEFIRRMFRTFRLHRLAAVIPLPKGGAIRMVKRMGFKEEGVIREAMRYGGQWVNHLLLSVLESEVGESGTGSTKG